MSAPDSYLAADFEPNRLLVAEQRLASAQAIFGRFEARQKELQGLLNELSKSIADHAVAPLRTIAFEQYKNSAAELFDFYGAIFTGDFTTPRRPSKASEQDIHINLSLFQSLRDPLSTPATDTPLLQAPAKPGNSRSNVLHQLLHHVRAHWIAARYVEGLAARDPLLSATVKVRESVEQRLDAVRKLDPEQLDEGIREVIRPHMRTAIDELQRTLNVLDDTAAWWQAEPRQELLYMLDTQGNEGQDRAIELVEKQQVDLDEALRVVDALVHVDNLLVEYPDLGDAVLDEQTNNALVRQAAEIAELQRLYEQSTVVLMDGREWVEARQAAVKIEQAALRNDLTKSFRFPTRERIRVQAPNAPGYPTTMIIAAHSDDETTMAAGVAAQASIEGEEVVLFSVTGGEAGRVQSEELDTPEGHANFTDRRSGEQLASAIDLGVTWVVRAGFIDSGMKDDPSTHALSLSNRNYNGLVAVLLEEFERFSPAQVFTHPRIEQQEAYQHPDHLLTYKATMEAALQYQRLYGREIAIFSVSVEDNDPLATSIFLTSDAAEQATQKALSRYVSQIPHGSAVFDAEPVGRARYFTKVNPAEEMQLIAEQPLMASFLTQGSLA